MQKKEERGKTEQKRIKADEEREAGRLGRTNIGGGEQMHKEEQ